jgi:hypothetical protein
MIYFLALLPATALTIGGYFVLYLAARSEGGMKTFGKYLGFWAFTLAGLVILGAIFAAAHHGHRGMRMGRMHPGMYGRMHGPWPGGGPGFFRPGMGPQGMGPQRFGTPAEGGRMPPPPGAAPKAPASSSSASSAGQ